MQTHHSSVQSHPQGFARTAARDLADFWETDVLGEAGGARRREILQAWARVEPFDEYEEWVLKLRRFRRSEIPYFAVCRRNYFLPVFLEGVRNNILTSFELRV